MDEMLESRVGKYCIIAYALFAIVSYGVSIGCGTEACSLAIIWPILPWAFILASDLGLSFPWAMYPVFILLNTSVAYVLGAGVEWLYHWYVDQRADVREHESVQSGPDANHASR